MKHKKLKVLLLCMTLAGVLAGCGGAANDKKDDSKVTASDDKTASAQEKNAADSGVVDKDAEEKNQGDVKETGQEAESDKANAAGAGETEGTKDDSAESGEAGTAKTSEAAWTFTNQDLEGNEVTQDVFKDKKLTMVNYWATFCGPCLREMPELGELNEEYADKGFQIIGVVADVMEDQNGELTNLDVAKDAVEATKADYLHLPITQEMLGGPVSNVQVVPTTVFVDENGNMVGEEQLGSKSKEDWAAIIDSYLEMV